MSGLQNLADSVLVNIVETQIGRTERNDRIKQVKLEVTYLVNRHLYASVGYTRGDRDSTDNTLSSDDTGRNYRIEALILRIQTQF